MRKPIPGWPKVVKGDDGIRPAGAPDACFYCKRKVGEYHAENCVTVVRTVRVRYSFEIDVNIPFFWTSEDFEDHRNNGSWCANNAINDIEAYSKRTKRCLCTEFKAEFVGNESDKPQRVAKPRRVR